MAVAVSIWTVGKKTNKLLIILCVNTKDLTTLIDRSVSVFLFVVYSLEGPGIFFGKCTTDLKRAVYK